MKKNARMNRDSSSLEDEDYLCSKRKHKFLDGLSSSGEVEPKARPRRKEKAVQPVERTRMEKRESINKEKKRLK